MQLAIIAHDGTKDRLRGFIHANKHIVEKLRITCTKSTSKIVSEFGIEVDNVESGPLGGDAQIAAKIVTKEIDAVIFLRDPLGKHPHEPDIYMLLRLCDVYQVPLATNFKTAEILLKHFNEKL
ncbi:MAG: methylglyoxal synthase [Flavobacteriales bacterium]